MSLRFKVGDLVRMLPGVHPEWRAGATAEVLEVYPNGCRSYIGDMRDYLVRVDYMPTDGDPRFLTIEKHLAPLDGDSSSRSTDTGALDPAWKRMREFLQVAAEVQREKQKERV